MVIVGKVRPGSCADSGNAKNWLPQPINSVLETNGQLMFNFVGLVSLCTNCLLPGNLYHTITGRSPGLSTDFGLPVLAGPEQWQEVEVSLGKTYSCGDSTGLHLFPY